MPEKSLRGIRQGMNRIEANCVRLVCRVLRWPCSLGASRPCLWCALLALCSASSLAQGPYRPGAAGPAEGAPRVPGFGPLQGERAVPGFGPAATATGLTITPEDLARADERLQRYDRNRDGYIDRSEAGNAPWREEPFQFDIDRDGRLSRVELARRYALRRVADAPGVQGPPPLRGTPSTPGSNPSWEEQQRRERERRAAEEAARGRDSFRGTRESWHLTETLMSRHDTNRDGLLDAAECRRMGLSAMSADTDRDQRINRPELAAWLAEQQAAQGRAVPPELPSWFVEKDVNSDGQVQMSEFAKEWTDERLDEFARLDLNRDGVIVPEECLQALNRMNEEYANHRFQMIPAKGTIRSEIDVEERETIADLDVQLSITHTHVSHLNVFLIGPEGQRVELFTGIGGQDDHFDKTILDEESPRSILRAAPPFPDRYQTEELSRGGKGLKQFYDLSMAGTWALLVEANSDRPGVLHGWSLIFRRAENGEPPGQKDFD